jgi:hypothetical protein
MTLHTPTPPLHGRTIAGGSSQHGRITSDALTTTAHQIFSATLQDVLEGRVLARAKPTSWRYVFDNGAADIVQREGKWVFASHSTDFSMDEALAVASEIAIAKDYELRGLAIPAVYATALWLHAPGEDILIPVAPTPSALTANHRYGEATFTAALVPLAQKRALIRGDQA